MAEKERFELSNELNTRYTLSRRAPSANSATSPIPNLLLVTTTCRGKIVYTLQRFLVNKENRYLPLFPLFSFSSFSSLRRLLLRALYLVS